MEYVIYEGRIPSLSHQSTVLSYCPCNPWQRLHPWECSRPLASAHACSESEGRNLACCLSWQIVDTGCQNPHWAAVVVSEAHGTTNNEITYRWHVCKVMHRVACWSYPLLLGLIWFVNMRCMGQIDADPKLVSCAKSKASMSLRTTVP